MYYAAAWKTLLNGNVPKDQKTDFATAFRTLRANDFSFLRQCVLEMDADKERQNRGENASHSRWESITGRSTDEPTQMMVQRCLLAGVLKERYGTESSRPTDLGCLIAKHALPCVEPKREE